MAATSGAYMHPAHRCGCCQARWSSG
jgi:hypothetical protein